MKLVFCALMGVLAACEDPQLATTVEIAPLSDKELSPLEVAGVPMPALESTPKPTPSPVPTVPPTPAPPTPITETWEQHDATNCFKGNGSYKDIDTEPMAGIKGAEACEAQCDLNRQCYAALVDKSGNCFRRGPLKLQDCVSDPDYTLFVRQGPRPTPTSTPAPTPYCHADGECAGSGDWAFCCSGKQHKTLACPRSAKCGGLSDGQCHFGKEDECLSGRSHRSIACPGSFRRCGCIAVGKWASKMGECCSGKGHKTLNHYLDLGVQCD